MQTPTHHITISRRTLRSIVNSPQKSATAVSLIYVHDDEPGITRVRKRQGFEYLMSGKKITDKREIQRIKNLVIPPAWEKVWICRMPNGHLQATGLDQKKRKQYRYHPLWNKLRSQTKFYRLHEFGKSLPLIRLQVEKDLSLPGLPLNKVLATVVSLMERTHIRIGNGEYERRYGSFGLTTLKDQHVNIAGSKISFSFTGKKGISHNLSIRSARLAKIVQNCKDIPGKELFQYYDEHGTRHSINSGMVNDYIKNSCGEDFSAKDFRTWAGTLYALIAFKECGVTETQSETKKKIVDVLESVSKYLGNTRTICKKYYIHPAVIQLYENNGLDKYIAQLDKIESDDNRSGLTAEEKVMMKILELTA